MQTFVGHRELFKLGTTVTSDICVFKCTTQ
jgi:hypothetical protein